MNISQALRRLSVLAAAFALASCASSPPEATFVTPLTAAIAQGDGVTTRVTTTDARMPEMERQALADRITQDVTALAQPGSGTRHRYELEVDITRYARGNGFMRSALPGTGQIHLDGVVSVYQMPKHTKVGEFMLSKSFMLPGGYSTLVVNMETISLAFSQGVARTVCQVH